VINKIKFDTFRFMLHQQHWFERSTTTNVSTAAFAAK